MPVTLDIQDDGHIVYAELIDPWTIEELIAAYDKEQQHRDNVNFKVHAIVNLQHMRVVPSGIISAGRRTPTLTHPRRGRLAVVDPSAFGQVLSQTLIRLTRSTSLRFFKTKEEALEHIRQVIAEEAPLLRPTQDANLK